MDRFPDAVKIPSKWAHGENSVQKAFSVVIAAEKILGVNHAIGERAWCSPLPTSEFFCTKNIACPQTKKDETLFFVTGHKMEGRHRYHWVPNDDDNGPTLGYLVDEAKAEVKRAVVSPVEVVDHA